MSHNEPKTRQEKKGKEPYNNKSLRIQEELWHSKSNEKTKEKTNEKLSKNKSK
jgi:hypothetical protein